MNFLGYAIGPHYRWFVAIRVSRLVFTSDLLFSVLNVGPSHRHIRVHRRLLEGFVLSYVKRALVSGIEYGYADGNLLGFNVSDRI